MEYTKEALQEMGKEDLIELILELRKEIKYFSDEVRYFTKKPSISNNN